MRKTARIEMRVEEHLLERVKLAAARRRMTVTTLIEQLLLEMLGAETSDEPGEQV